MRAKLLNHPLVSMLLVIALGIQLVAGSSGIGMAFCFGCPENRLPANFAAHTPPTPSVDPCCSGAPASSPMALFQSAELDELCNCVQVSLESTTFLFVQSPKELAHQRSLVLTSPALAWHSVLMLGEQSNFGLLQPPDSLDWRIGSTPFEQRTSLRL